MINHAIIITPTPSVTASSQPVHHPAIVSRECIVHSSILAFTGRGEGGEEDGSRKKRKENGEERQTSNPQNHLLLSNTSTHNYDFPSIPVVLSGAFVATFLLLFNLYLTSVYHVCVISGMLIGASSSLSQINFFPNAYHFPLFSPCSLPFLLLEHALPSNPRPRPYKVG